MHQRSTITLLLLISVLFSSSCHKEIIDVDLRANRWKVIKIKTDSQHSYVSADNDYFLEFVNETSLIINLTVNHCGGLYEIVSNGEIYIEPLFCTEMCCDTDFAVELSLLLHKMNKYYGLGDELYLEGEGSIVLRCSD